MKDTNKKMPPKVEGYTGHEVIAHIFGVSMRWVSRVLRGHVNDSKDYKGEIERYKAYQNAYINRRRSELGIDK